MATNDVPGANPANLDLLSVGCWGEDRDGTSLIHVVGRENGSVVFQMYDLTNGMFYQDAMIEAEFKRTFSVPPVGNSIVPWTWHDKTSFPWNRVMKRFQRPAPQHADVLDQMSAAERVARHLNLRSRELREEDVADPGAEPRRRGYAIMDRLAEAIGRFTR